MRGNSLRGNREASEAPLFDGVRGRPANAERGNAGMDASEESDGLTVPTKSANKAPEGAAEPVEGGGPAEGNALLTRAPRTQSRKRASLGLEGVRRVARGDKDVRFTALLHHVDVDLLRDCYFRLRKDASPGLDGQTWAAYGDGLEARLADLHGRIHRGAYRPPAAKRSWIPKADGSQRALGLSTVEDKIVQAAVKRVLEAIYEVDFRGFSYGFRPGRNQHNALDAVSVGMTKRKVNWVLDADIRGFFDTIDHGWLGIRGHPFPWAWSRHGGCDHRGFQPSVAAAEPGGNGAVAGANRPSSGPVAAGCGGHAAAPALGSVDSELVAVER